MTGSRPPNYPLERGGTIELAAWGQPLLRAIFSYRAASYSLEATADAVVQDGLVPKRHLRRFNGPSRKSMIEKIIKNPFYRGEFLWRGTIYAGAHEPIVSRKEWEQIQAIGQRPTKSQKRGKGTFSDWMRCEECGCKITYDPKTKPSGKVYPYYRCANGKRMHPRLKYVSEKTILTALEPAVDSIQITEMWAEKIAHALNETHRKVKKARKAEARKFQAALDGLEDREDQLYDDLRAGTLDDGAYKRQLERVRADRRRFTELLEGAQEELD